MWLTPEAVQRVLAAMVPAEVILLALNWRGRSWAELGRMARRQPLSLVTDPFLNVGRGWGPVLRAVLWGAGAAVPAYYLEKALTVQPWTFTNFGVLFLFAMVVAGMVEESCKFLAFHLGPGRSSWFAEEYDGILFGAAVAMGFATVENVLYVGEFGMTTAWVRGLTAVPMHAACGVLMGSYLGLARVRRSVRWSDAGLPLSGLALAVALHGSYDALAFHDSSVLSQWLLLGLVAAALAWCVWRVREARRRSLVFGGSFRPLPPPLWSGPMRVPSPPAGRVPWLAGALGFIPGLGQLYNGDRFKAAVFFAVASVNLALYYCVHFFVYQPGSALLWLRFLGVVPTVMIKPEDFAAAVSEKWMLVPLLMSMVLTWEIIGALDAYLAARASRLRPQLAVVRRSFLSHGFGSSYVLHLVAVFMIVFVPIFRAAGGGGQDGSEKAKAGQNGDVWHLTWVQSPSKLMGFDPKHAEGKDSATGAQQVGERIMPTRGGAPGMVKVLPGRHGRQRHGEAKSYDEYLSSQIRRNDGDSHYFKHVPPGVWTVVQYTIDRDGDLTDVHLVKSSGTYDMAQRAVEVVQNAAPYAPLPGHVKSIEVTELFWSQATSFFDPGTLEDRLSHLPDGRFIVPQEN